MYGPKLLRLYWPKTCCTLLYSIQAWKETLCVYNLYCIHTPQSSFRICVMGITLPVHVNLHVGTFCDMWLVIRNSTCGSLTTQLRRTGLTQLCSCTTRPIHSTFHFSFISSWNRANLSCCILNSLVSIEWSVFQTLHTHNPWIRIYAESFWELS